MIIVTSLEDIPELPPPLALTIGSFDGLHLGHLALLQHLKKKATKQGTAAILTFRNHPSDVIPTKQPTQHLCSFQHKMQLFKTHGIDLCIVLDFTKELAALSYDRFLQMIKDYYPFTHLILGEGATFGKDLKGTPENIHTLQESLHFQAEYLPKTKIDNTPISSTLIRHHIQKKELEQASKLLGRPYSFYGTFSLHPENHNIIYLPLDSLCLPPEGKYNIELHVDHHICKGPATITHSPPRLSIEFSTPLDTVINKNVEVILQERDFP